MFLMDNDFALYFGFYATRTLFEEDVEIYGLHKVPDVCISGAMANAAGVFGQSDIGNVVCAAE